MGAFVGLHSDGIPSPCAALPAQLQDEPEVVIDKVITFLGQDLALKRPPSEVSLLGSTLVWTRTWILSDPEHTHGRRPRGNK